MILEIENNQIGALKWLALKGMELTKSNSRYDAFERISDQLYDRTLVGEHTVVIKIKSNKNSITGTVYLNGEWYTEMGCSGLSDLFKTLSEHEINEKINNLKHEKNDT